MRVLFVYQALSTFVEKDKHILEGVHEVRPVHFRGLGDIPRLWQGALWCDITFSWFGKLHAFFAVLFSKLLGKKAIVVAGGDDVAYEPSIKYGMSTYWWKKWCPLFVFQYADLILSVSEFNRHETIQNSRSDPKKVKLLYHGFDPVRFQSSPVYPKANKILTVAGGGPRQSPHTKGLYLFVESATYLSDLEFLIVGPWLGHAGREVKSLAPPNVTFVPELDQSDLVKLYSQAMVYVQASYHESFCLAVAEAMLCECVPVVSRLAALPEVVGDCGLYIDRLDAKELAGKIQEAMYRPDLGKAARKRIKRLFPLDRRKKELLKALASLTDGHL